MDICIQIGNTDNKLTQQDWANYIKDIYELCVEHGTVHFSGGSSAEKHYQNYCFCVSGVDRTVLLKGRIEKIRAHFKQDSVAWLHGKTDFV